jgi:hypothetical protein
VVNLDALFTLSEIAVTMIGVSGLVAIFLSNGNLEPADRLRFYVILTLGILAALLGYVPYWASKYIGDAYSVWKFSSVVALMLLVPTVSMPILLFMNPMKALKTAVPNLFIFFNSLFPIAVATTFLTNALSWPVEANSTLYEIALFLMIGDMTFQFGSLVLFRARTSVATEDV